MPKTVHRSTPPNYDLVASLYDFEYAECNGAELRFWDLMLRRAGGSALELGVGTGRVAVPLARLGHKIWGIDTSHAMLERARAKSAGLPLARRSNLRLYRQDMRAFQLRRRFALIYVPFNSLLLLPRGSEVNSCLQRVAAHLAPDGLFVADVFGMSAHDREPDVEMITFLEPEPVTGAEVTRERSYSFDPVCNQAHVSLIYSLRTDNENSGQIAFEYSLQLYEPDELLGMVASAGFVVEAVYGGYDMSPQRAEAENLVIVSRPAASRLDPDS